MHSKITDIILSDLKRFAYKSTLRTTLSEKIADSCAKAVIKCITLNFKTRLMYIPSVASNNKSMEYNNIREDFNGKNYAELAVKYKRSLQHIYTITKHKKPKIPHRPQAIEIIEDYLPVELIRSGLSQAEAESLAENVAHHLQQTFPGISFYVPGDWMDKNPN